MKIVISVGGSIIYGTNKNLDKNYIREISKFINKLQRGGNKIAIVTGGGELAGDYIEIAREFNASEAFCDLIGIDISRMNARILAIAIGDNAVIEPPKDFQKAKEEMDNGRIVVMGGTHPGHSTDGVSALLAEYVNADLLINATDVDGIYDKDPEMFKNAKLYDKISINKLLKMVQEKSINAGEYKLIDMLAVKIIQRSKIKTIFLNGRDIKNMQRAIEGNEFKGTMVIND
ncbi:MAG: UMP kinase [Candidatus Altiarchaeales archaeon]|nr:MAG: UMP kinase [Candidatus Altiarchaeales archaeon]